jgi:hypothetical protein
MTTFDPNTIQSGSSRWKAINAKYDLDNQQCKADMLKLIPAFQQAILKEMHKRPYAFSLDISDSIPIMPDSCVQKTTVDNQKAFVELGAEPFFNKQWEMIMVHSLDEYGVRDCTRANFYLHAKNK